MTWTCRKDGKERKKISSLSYRLMIPRAMLACQPLRGLVTKALSLSYHACSGTDSGKAGEVSKLNEGFPPVDDFKKKIKESVRFTNYSAY